MKTQEQEITINNRFYDELGERWYNDDKHIVALLRAESRIKLDYVKRILHEKGIDPSARILDIACGAGFISNELARSGWQVSGVDLSESSINVAARHAPHHSNPDYRPANAYDLPFPDQSFDVVMLLDFLEHVDEPLRALTEAKRVLKPHGILFFYTFNRTQMSRFLAIRAVEMIARDCPKNFHVWRLFIKPRELDAMLRSLGLQIGPLEGVRPQFLSRAFWSSLIKRSVHREFVFQYTRDLRLGYLGFALQDLTNSPNLYPKRNDFRRSSPYFHPGNRTKN